MSVDRNLLKNAFLIISPLILFVIIMLPRLLSPQFGFIDDAQTILISESILDGTWDPSNDVAGGRFRPVFWIYYALLSIPAGREVFWYFVGNAILFLGITAGITTIVHKYSGSGVQAAIAGILFVLAGPMIEVVYTLNKGELQQGFLLVIFLLVYGLYRKVKSKRYQAIAILVGALMVFFAVTAKETAGVLLPIILLWIIIEWTFRPQPFKAEWLISTILGVAGYLLLRVMVSSFVIPEGSYTSNFNFQAGHMLSQLKVLLDLVNHSFLYLLPLTVVPLIRLIRQRTLPQLQLIMKSIVWMVVWISIYLPWNFSREYYLFPFAGGVAVLSSSLVVLNLQAVRQQRAKLAIGMMAAAILLFLLTLPNTLTNARLQLAVDASNQKMLDYVLENVPDDGVIRLNIQVENEYAGNFITWVNTIHERSDVQIDRFDPSDVNQASPEAGELYIVSPVLENHFYPSVRMGVYEGQTREWNESLQNFLKGQGSLIYQGRTSFRLFNIDSLRIFCPALKFLAYCQVPNAPIDRRIFSYGWDIYRLTISSPDL